MSETHHVNCPRHHDLPGECICEEPSHRGPEWSATEPPKDGTAIIAIGRVIWSDDISTSVDPFTSEIVWTKDTSGYEGWHYSRTQMTVARTLEDEVKVDCWTLPPGAKIEDLRENIAAIQHTASEWENDVRDIAGALDMKLTGENAECISGEICERIWELAEKARSAESQLTDLREKVESKVHEWSFSINQPTNEDPFNSVPLKISDIGYSDKLIRFEAIPTSSPISERALEQIKYFCLTTTKGKAGDVLCHIIRLCVDAGVKKTLPELKCPHFTVHESGDEEGPGAKPVITCKTCGQDVTPTPAILSEIEPSKGRDER